jgi:hypothetical protein
MAVFNLNFTWMTKIQHFVLFRCRYILISYFLFLILFYFFRGLHHFVEIGFNMYLEHPKSEDQTTK